MKVSRLRLPCQLALHAVLVGHILAYYLLDWKRIGGADIQDFFHNFLGSGLVSAGVILAAAAFAITLVFGRVFCGWGCHFGGTQDLAAWILRKLGLRMPPIRTRFLHLLPFILLAGCFVLPEIARWLSPPAGEAERFELRVDFGQPPWANLPGFFVSTVTFLACGAGILLFMGTRGFCRFVCPYGAVFRMLHVAAPFRIRRTSPCSSTIGSTIDSGAKGGSGCASDAPSSGIAGSAGHASSGGLAPCTAACPTGVNVHAETQRLGAVRDWDCIQCHLCVEACPSGALTAGFAAAGAATPEREAIPAPPEPRGGEFLEIPVRRAAPPPHSFPLGQEVLIATASVLAYLAWDLVYAAHFLAATMALGEGFLAWLVLEAIRRPDFRIGAVRLREGGRWTFAGATVLPVFLFTLVCVLNAGAFKTLRWLGDRAYREAAAAALAASAPQGARDLSAAERDALERAEKLYVSALGLMGLDRRTAFRRATALERLGDPRAVAAAEDLCARDEGDLDARELRRRVLLRFRGIPEADAGGLLDTHPAPR